MKIRKYNDIKVSNPDSPYWKVGWVIILTLVIAMSGLVIHEYNHAWGSAIVGDPTHRISYDFKYLFNKIPIPVTGYAFSIDSGWFTKLAGGFFTAVIFLGIALWARWTKSLVDYYIEYAFMFVGLCHLFYSFWETLFLWNIDFGMYKLGAYLIYLLTFIGYTILVRKELRMYIYGNGINYSNSNMW